MTQLASSIAIAFLLAVGSALPARADEPKFARAFYERGVIHEQHHRYAEALADYSRAIKLDARFADAYFHRSGIYAWNLPLEQRDYAKAVTDLTKILEIAPNDFSARFNRGLCHESLRQYDDAIGDYSRIIEGEPDFSRTEGKQACLARTYHYRGRTYQWYKQDHAKAVADYTEALRLDPQIEMVHYRRGQSYNALNEYSKAQDDFTTALARDPNYPNLLCAYAWQLAACPDAKFRDGKKALELARRANERVQFTAADHLEALAASYAEIGQFEEAIKRQKQALERLSNQAQTRPERQMAMLMRLKQYESGNAYRVEQTPGAG